MVQDGGATAKAGLAAAKLARARIGQFEEPGAHRHTDTLFQLVSEIDRELRGTNKMLAHPGDDLVDGSVAHVFTVGDRRCTAFDRRARQAGAERTGTRRLAAFWAWGLQSLRCSTWTAGSCRLVMC